MLFTVFIGRMARLCRATVGRPFQRHQGESDELQLYPTNVPQGGRLGGEGVMRAALVLQCAMPVAVFNFLFVERYNNQPGEVAGMVVISTVLSFATLPFLLAFVM